MIVRFALSSRAVVPTDGQGATGEATARRLLGLWQERGVLVEGTAGTRLKIDAVPERLRPVLRELLAHQRFETPSLPPITEASIKTQAARIGELADLAVLDPDLAASVGAGAGGVAVSVRPPELCDVTRVDLADCVEQAKRTERTVVPSKTLVSVVWLDLFQRMPRWTAENRQFLDGAKPAITGA